MNEHEARLFILHQIRDVLTDLAAETSEVTQDDLDSFTDVAEIMMEALGIDIVKVEGDKIHTTMTVLD